MTTTDSLADARSRGRRLRTAAWLLAALILLAVNTEAANTGFRLLVDLRTGNNMVSLPYLYFPSGDLNQPAQNAQDLCRGAVRALGCDILNLGKFTTSGAPLTVTCFSPFSNFDLIAGHGLFLNLRGPCTAVFVGSHDDSYSFGRGSSTVPLDPRGNKLLAVPYHTVQRTAQEMCFFLNSNFGGGSDLTGLVHFTPVGPYLAMCGSPFQDFDLVPGEGVYFLVSEIMNIQFETY